MCLYERTQMVQIKLGLKMSLWKDPLLLLSHLKWSRVCNITYLLHILKVLFTAQPRFWWLTARKNINLGYKGSSWRSIVLCSQSDQYMTIADWQISVQFKWLILLRCEVTNTHFGYYTLNSNFGVDLQHKVSSLALPFSKRKHTSLSTWDRNMILLPISLNRSPSSQIYLFLEFCYF